MANGTPRNGNNAWWTSIYSLALASAATALDIWTNGIDRLSDRTVWLYNQIVLLRANLANATAGTRATVTDSVDLTTLVYDPIIGTVNGLTLQLTADLGGTLTVTFGVGALAPTGPGDVVAAIVAAVSAYQSAFEDAAGHLNLASNTTGGTSTITVTGGTALSALGFTSAQNAAGAASGADGISQVSGAQIVAGVFTVPAGTLRAMLAYILARVPSSVAATVQRLSLVTLPTAGWAFVQNAYFASVNTAPNLVFPIVIPQGATINAVSITIEGSQTDTALPANLPTLAVYQVNSSGVRTQIGTTTTDAPANVTAYKAPHAMTVVALAAVVDNSTYSYFVQLTGEAGTNSNTGMQAGPLQTQWNGSQAGY